MQESGTMIDLLLSGLVALLVSAAFHAGLARKVYNLQMDLAMLSAQFLRERNQRASLARSKDKEALEVLNELKQGQPAVVANNNPLAKFGIKR